MKVTWLIPDTYGFLLDEIEALAPHIDSLRILTGDSVSTEIRKRLPSVEFIECPERTLLPFGSEKNIFRRLALIHGVRRLIAHSRHTREIAGVYKVLQRLEAESPSDVLHSHFAYPGGLGATALVGTPQVVTLRGYDILTTGNYGALWNPFFRRTLIHSYSQGTTITCGTHYSAHRARQILGSEADIRHIPQGLPHRSFQAAGKHSRISLGIHQDEIVLVSAANLVEVKNHQLLINAFHDLVNSTPLKFRLLICGDGPLASRITGLAESRGIMELVHFMGRLPRSELTDIFKLSDIFVHTSMSEGFGNVIPEAILHNLLIVASPVGVAPELIRHGDNGYLPALGDLQSWTACLTEATKGLDNFRSKPKTDKEAVMARHSMKQRIESFHSIYSESIRNNAIQNIR